MKDQQVLGIWGQCQLFRHSVETLYSQLEEKGEGAELVWDKVMGCGAACAAGDLLDGGPARVFSMADVKVLFSGRAGSYGLCHCGSKPTHAHLQHEHEESL